MSTQKLFNQKVVKTQAVQRPMTSSDGRKNIPFAKHSGVVVTLENGSKHLVHKGRGYSPSNPTVITPASNMSKNWKPVGSQRSGNGKTVGSMMKNGSYSLTNANCNHATTKNSGNSVKCGTFCRNIKPKK